MAEKFVGEADLEKVKALINMSKFIEMIRKDKEIEIAKSMLKDNMDISLIAKHLWHTNIYLPDLPP